MLSEMVNDLDHESSYQLTLKDGMKQVFADQFDVVFLDVWMPDGNGLESLAQIRNAPSSPEIIMITGSGDPDGAEAAIKNGVWDYIEKPLSKEKTTLALMRALQYRSEKHKSKRHRPLDTGEIIGRSPEIKRCFELISRASDSNANALITGETGTGKELFARAIHNNSSRCRNDFVVVDCAALPETLVESVLFGHEKGAFTGADRSQQGLISQAHMGTLFLDEVGELPVAIQAAFLRVLQERRFRKVGGKTEIDSNFRLICATNRDLDKMVNSGKFRQDLLFRLRSLVVELPPLRNRIADIKELAGHYMKRLCDRSGLIRKEFSPEFFEMVGAYGWPGNVRELVGALENAIITAGGAPVLYPWHLPAHIRIEVARASVGRPKTDDMPPFKNSDTELNLEQFKDHRSTAIAQTEKSYLINLMDISRGKINQATHISGLSRSRLYDLLKKHHIARFN